MREKSWKNIWVFVNDLHIYIIKNVQKIVEKTSKYNFTTYFIFHKYINRKGFILKYYASAIQT